MQKNGANSWRCAPRNNERMAEWYDNLTGLEYLGRQLRHRRRLALYRKAVRDGEV